MELKNNKEWRSPGSKDPESFPWDICRLEDVMKQAIAPKVTFEKQLWCIKVISRCVNSAKPHEKIELRKNSQFLPIIRYIFSNSLLSTPLGAKIHHHILSIYLYLLGEDIIFDELLVMDMHTVNLLVNVLGEEIFSELKYMAILVVRRISELTHVNSIIVFEESIFNILQDIIEDQNTPSQFLINILYIFVNICGNPKLNFKLARSRRVVFFAIDTLIRILELNIIKKASKKMHHLMNKSPSPIRNRDETLSNDQIINYSLELPQYVSHAFEYISKTIPCAMIIANLLSFQENRISMLNLYPDLLRALELCDSQKLSIRLWEIARCATDYLHEDDTLLEAELLKNLGTPIISSRIPDSNS